MSDAQNTGSPCPASRARCGCAMRLRQARIEAADRTGVVVDLRDAEVARLEILNEALDPLFAQIPEQVDLFDRGISQGDTPRLWIDVVAHVVMGRDKRIYRFVQDTRFGRIVLAESHDVAAIVDAVTDYVARRMIEREHAMVGDARCRSRRSPRSRAAARFWIFVLGFMLGAARCSGRVLRLAELLHCAYFAGSCARAASCYDQPAAVRNCLDRACASSMPRTVCSHRQRIAVALDRKQIIGRGRIAAVRERRCRGHADRGYLAVGAVEPHRRMNVVVAVQDQLDAVPFQQRQQLRRNPVSRLARESERSG